MITLYILMLINGQIVEHPTANFHNFHVRVCLEAANKNMNTNPNTIWVCK